MAVVLLTYNKYEYTYSWTVFGNTFRSWACLGMYAGILSLLPPPPPLPRLPNTIFNVLPKTVKL